MNTAAKKKSTTSEAPTTRRLPRSVNENSTSTSTATIQTEMRSSPTVLTAREAALVTARPTHGIRHEMATPAPATLWHAVPSYPTVIKIWQRLLETYGRDS